MIHPKTLLISRHFYSLESYVWKSIYNLKIDTISTYDIPLDRSFLKLWNGIRHVIPSTDRRLELKEKTSMAQNAWQAFVYANGLRRRVHSKLQNNTEFWKWVQQSCNTTIIIHYTRCRQPMARVPSLARGTIFNGTLSELKYSNYDLIKKLDL